jgi:ubiquitin C-terminal hydrolase
MRMENGDIDGIIRLHKTVNSQHSINTQYSSTTTSTTATTTSNYNNINSDILGNLTDLDLHRTVSNSIKKETPMCIEDVPSIPRELSNSSLALIPSTLVNNTPKNVNHHANHTHYHDDYYTEYYSQAYREKLKEFEEEERYNAIKDEINRMKGSQLYQEIDVMIKTEQANIKKHFELALQKKKDEHKKQIELVQERREKINVNGVTGLSNMGNTCYMNAVLQVISNLSPFNNYILKRAFEDVLREKAINKAFEKFQNDKGLTDSISGYGSLTDLSSSTAELSLNGTFTVDPKVVEEEINNTFCSNLYNLMNELWKKNIYVKPKTMRELIKLLDPIFEDAQQQDSQELLGQLLNKIHEEIKRNIYTEEAAMNFKQKLYNTKLEIEQNIDAVIDEKLFKIFCDFWTKHSLTESSIITDYFTGVTIKVIECLVCRNETITPEIFMMVGLSMTEGEKECTIEDLFRREYTQEHLHGENAYSCDTCKAKTEAMSYNKIILPPRILIVMFKRFLSSWDTRINNIVTKKIETMVKYPIQNLNINEATVNNSAMSFIHNMGNSSYVYGYEYDLCSIIKHIGGSLNSGHYTSSCLNKLTKGWYNFNDATVHHIRTDEVEKSLVQKDSYILIYSSKKTLDNNTTTTTANETVQVNT